MKFPEVINFAHDILDMHRELVQLRQEVERLKEYEQKYFDLLSESIIHSQDMMGNILMLTLTPGVTEAMQAHAEARNNPT